MPRAKRNPVAREPTKEEKISTVKMTHFVKNGTVFFNGKSYAVKNHQVEVLPEDARAMKEHISLGR